MTERELADLLRHVDDDVAPDAPETEFKMRLRADLDETLGRDRPDMTPLVPVDPSPGRARNRLLVVAAAVIAVVTGALVVAQRPASDAPSSPAGTSAPTTTTTVPVFDAPAACARFRASNADELLEQVIPDDLTVAELNDAVDAIDVLLADVEAAEPEDPLGTVLIQVRNAVQEAARLLDVDNRVGALAALDVARIESRTRPEGTQFTPCFQR